MLVESKDKHLIDLIKVIDIKVILTDFDLVLLL
jgi:hypothetical protein